MQAIFLILVASLLGIGCSGEYQEASLTIEDFRFNPTQLRLLSDQPIRLVVRNHGRELHRFKSRMFADSDVKVVGKPEGEIFDAKQGLAIAPGKSVELILTLSSGVYDFRCPIKGHRGMKGMFVVEEAGSE